MTDDLLKRAEADTHYPGVSMAVMRGHVRNLVAALRAEREAHAANYASLSDALHTEQDRTHRYLARAEAADALHMQAEARLDSVGIMLAGADSQIETLAKSVSFHEKNAIRAEAAEKSLLECKNTMERAIICLPRVVEERDAALALLREVVANVERMPLQLARKIDALLEKAK